MLDCALTADPHRYITHEQRFRELYVLEIEMIYKLRDTLLQLNTIQKNTRYSIIVITAFVQLMNYQDEEENTEIYTHCWEILQNIRIPVIIGIAKKSMQAAFAKMRCDILIGV